MKTRPQMLEEGRAAYEEWLEERYFRSQEALLADFALTQMRPLEKRIADLERRLAIAVEALVQIAGADYRGNRPSESVCAFKALDAIRKHKPVDTTAPTA